MGGGLSDFFLGTQPSTTTYSTLSPTQTGVNSKLSNYLSSQTGKGATPYTGQLTAPLSSQQNQGLGLLDSYASGTPSQVQQGNTALQGLLSGTPALSPSATTNYNNLFNTGVYQPAMDKWKTDVLPQIDETANANGLFYGTPRQQAESDSMKDLQDSLATARANYLLNANKTATQGMVAALPQALNYASEPLTQVNALMNYGAVPQENTQTALSNQYAEWQRQQPEYSPLLSDELSYINQTQQGMYATPGTSGALSAFSPLAGAGLAGMGYGSSGATSLSGSKSGGGTTSGGFNLNSLLSMLGYTGGSSSPGGIASTATQSGGALDPSLYSLGDPQTMNMLALYAGGM